MSGVIDLLRQSGYSEKAIEYYLNKVNVGRIKNPTVNYAYTGPCGDTMEMYLLIESNTIKEANFQAIGCAGAFAAGSALTELVKEKTLGEAEKMEEQDIVSFLGRFPNQKIHCACLAKRTLRKAIKKYRESIRS